MEEKLIEEVKKHEVLYKKSSLAYRNKIKRAAAWNSIAKELNVPENVCQARWKSLRDRFVKKHSESYHASGSGAEIEETQWQYQQQMEFLLEHIKPRKTVTSLSSTQPLYKSEDDSSADQLFYTIIEEDRSQSMESLVDSSFLDEELKPCSEDPPPSVPTFSSESSFEVPSSSRKRPRRESDHEAFSEFLNKMTKIAETRFAVPSSQKESSAHEGFFSMVREIFEDLPRDVVKNAKFFIINYLQEQVAATTKN